MFAYNFKLLKAHRSQAKNLSYKTSNGFNVALLLGNQGWLLFLTTGRAAATLVLITGLQMSVAECRRVRTHAGVSGVVGQGHLGDCPSLPEPRVKRLPGAPLRSTCAHQRPAPSLVPHISILAEQLLPREGGW